MITMLFFTALFPVPRFLFGWIPTMTLPTFFQSGTGPGTFGGDIADWTSAMGQFNNWLPFDQLGPCLLIVAASVGVALTIRAGRIIASFLTGGGGSAA